VKLESNADNSLEAVTSNTTAKLESTDTLSHPDADVSDSSLDYFAELLGDDLEDESLGIQPKCCTYRDWATPVHATQRLSTQ
jgi:hypothetical protein